MGLLALALSWVLNYANASSSVTVCHSGSELSVNENAVAGHLGHGDFVVDAEHPCPPVETPPPVDLCPEEGVQTTLPCAEVPPPPTDLCPEEVVQTELPCEVVEPPTPPSDPPTSTVGSVISESHRHQGGGIVWCTATRTTFCRDRVQEIKGQLIVLISQLITVLQNQLDSI